MIAKEMVRIDVDLLDDSAQSQLDDTPIMAGRAAAARLPSVHPFTVVGIFIWNENSATRFQEILLLREELVVRENRIAADLCRCQIDKTSGGGFW